MYFVVYVVDDGYVKVGCFICVVLYVNVGYVEEVFNVFGVLEVI